METQRFHEKFEKIPVTNIQVQLAMSTTIEAESSKLFKNAGKNIYGANVGPRSASEKRRRMFSSKRRDSESSTDIDRQNQRPRHEF